MTFELIHEFVDRIIQEYPPQSCQEIMPDRKHGWTHSVYSAYQETIPYGWHLRYGNLHISIQCGKFNYADYYRFGMEPDFYHDHPITHTAEVAVRSWAYPYQFLRHLDGEKDYDSDILAWANVDQIEDVFKTVAAYANAPMRLSIS